MTQSVNEFCEELKNPSIILSVMNDLFTHGMGIDGPDITNNVRSLPDIKVWEASDVETFDEDRANLKQK